MTTIIEKNVWSFFLDQMKKKCSHTEYQNWLEPIKFITIENEILKLEIPNIFVERYLLDNYKKEMLEFLPKDENDNLLIEFIVKAKHVQKQNIFQPNPFLQKDKKKALSPFNKQYTFENFIEGPSNQFVKSAALGVASSPGKSFNPLFIHGGVGLGKTHILHGIGHFVKNNHKKLNVKYITTESFINDLVFNLRNKSIDKMKKYYRSLDVLLVDDIQFLQNRANFEEEFCNTFESLINQNKQIVITSDQPPSQLNLSERMIARMEWGLVANIGVPDLETRVAIIQHKAEQKNIEIPTNVCFFIADHIYNNVRQLEGAINRLSAYCRLMKVNLTEEIAENLLSEMFEYKPLSKISIEAILKATALVFEVRVGDIKGDSRLKNIALSRQVAMYLSKELLDDSLSKIAANFGGKTHSTLLHAWKKISEKIKIDKHLQKQIQLIKKNLNN